jgi:hypothetical protein
MSAVLRGCGAACVSSRAAVVRSPATRLAGGGARGPRCRVQSRVVRVSSSLAEGQRKVSSIEAAVKLTGEAKEAFVGQLQFGNGKQVEENAMREAMKAAEAGLVEMDMDVGEELLEQAFERCRKVTAEYAKTFYLGVSTVSPASPRAHHRVNRYLLSPPCLGRYHPHGGLDLGIAHRIDRTPARIHQHCCSFS